MQLFYFYRISIYTYIQSITRQIYGNSYEFPETCNRWRQCNLRASFFLFFFFRRPYGLWTESGRIGMLHKRGNCVSGNWQLPKSDGGSGVDNSARARARDFADRRKNRREYEWGCARKFRMDHRTSNTLVINLHILQRHLPRLRPQHRIGSDRIGIAIIMQSAVRPIHREKEREAFF